MVVDVEDASESCGKGRVTRRDEERESERKEEQGGKVTKDFDGGKGTVSDEDRRG